MLEMLTDIDLQEEIFHKNLLFILKKVLKYAIIIYRKEMIKMDKEQLVIQNMKDNIKRLEDKLDEANTKLYKYCVKTVVKDKHLNKYNVGLEFSEFWECPESPTGFCVYDLYSNSGRDRCLYCGQPDERK